MNQKGSKPKNIMSACLDFCNEVTVWFNLHGGAGLKLSLGPSWRNAGQFPALTFRFS